ncbi:YchJ family protein [Flavobacterium sp. LB2R40]|uniref:YchJ family protein n=1 Tax=unclassified Flavobacterium TaxID=196869 RepID=UPI003AAABA9D
MTENKCYCGSDITFSNCCEPFIKGDANASTAETLMRSRYSAYVSHKAVYLWATTHITEREKYTQEEILNWAINNHWLQLEIINTTENTVEFKAYFLDTNLQKHIHHELSTFKFENGSWFYVNGKFFN